MTPGALGQVLVNAINRNGVEHSGLSLETIEETLWRLLRAVQGERERREGSSDSAVPTQGR